MARAKLKFSQAISDRTIQQDSDNDDEGMEAVLFHNKDRRQRRHRRSKKENEGDDVSAVYESSQTKELLELVQNMSWETLLYRVLKDPELAHIKFPGHGASAGNFVLHEACKENAPVDVIEALIEANEKAIETKGNSGYLPFHYACAHGASIKLIRFLHSLHENAVRAVDDVENVLPLHLACMNGTTKEEVYMCLLTSYPEGSLSQDYFGRRPIDYAKSIRDESHRKVAIECLKRATWLEISAKLSRSRTESDFHLMIKGYEKAQAEHLKKIQVVHTKEIAELEERIDSRKKEVDERCQDLEVLDQHLQEMTDQFRERMESMEKAMKAKNRKLQGQLDKAKAETTKVQVALDIKVEEAVDISQKLKMTKDLNDSLERELEERTEDLDMALDDIDNLNKHSEWLESVLGSIRKASTSESPVLRNRSGNESSTTSKYESTRKIGSHRKSKDSASVASKKSVKSLRGVSSGLQKASRNSPDETREASIASSIASRIIGSYRE